MKHFLIIFLFIFILTACWEEESTTQWENWTKQWANIERWAKSGSWSRDWTGVERWAKSGSWTRDSASEKWWITAWLTWAKGTWTDFFIDTKTVKEFNTVSTMEKIGKVVAGQNIELKSQVSWKLSNVYVKQGQKVYAGQKVAQIQDSYSKYYLDLDKTQIDLDKQYITKDSQILSLDQKITDAKISLDDALKTYNNAKLTFESDKESAQINLESIVISTKADKEKAIINYEKTQLAGWTTEAQLEYEKAEVDYNNTLNSNAQQLKTNIENIKKEYNNLYLSLWDITRFWDELFWITTNYKDDAREIRNYLWAKDSVTKNAAKDKLTELIRYKEDMADYDISNITEENMLESMQGFSDGYFEINTYLDYMEKTLENSITSLWILSQSEIDGYISNVNNYQNSNQSNNSSFTNTQNSIKTFLNSYKLSELSALKNVELQKIKLETSAETSEVDYNESLLSLENDVKSSQINFDKTLVNIENSLNSTKTKLDQAQQNYNNALKNKDVTLRSLNNAIASAVNTRKQAQAEYSKLTIVSPISWVVGTLNTDLNTEITSGTSILTIAWDSNTQIEVTLNATEISQVTVWDKVKVQYWNKEYDSSVYSKSSVADENLGYTVWIVMNEKVELLWGSTVVKFLWDNSWLFVPLQIVEIWENNKGVINTFVDGKIDTIDVDLWKIEGNNVEILTSIQDSTQIITTDIWNFNAKNQTLTTIKK